MKQPAGQMANPGVSSYEGHMGAERRSHEGSQSKTPNAVKGKNAGMHEGAPHDADNYSGPGRHDLGM